MILYELTGTDENHPAYQDLEFSNGNRQHSFLQAIVTASLQIRRLYLSTQVIKALNYHAIACLHTGAGEFRQCPVTVGSYSPPEHYRVQALMDDFVNDVNRNWDGTDPIYLAAFVLWKLNAIHPFINGNGRTARASCYFALCVKIGNWLPGTIILPELIRQHHPEYVQALQEADASLQTDRLDLSALCALLARLLQVQLGSRD